jgi:hypothetical protein
MLLALRSSNVSGLSVRHQIEYSKTFAIEKVQVNVPAEGLSKMPVLAGLWESTAGMVTLQDSDKFPQRQSCSPSASQLMDAEVKLTIDNEGAHLDAVHSASGSAHACEDVERRKDPGAHTPMLQLQGTAFTIYLSI